MQNEFVVTGGMVVEEARTWMGTPFLHQAAVRGRGCDCIGLVRGVGYDLEICDFDPNCEEGRYLLAYPREPEPRRLIGALNKYFVRIRDDFKKGDIVLFAMRNVPTHVAILTNVNKNTVIHTWLAAGKVIENRVMDDFQPTGVWRYPGVAHPAGDW